MKTAANDRVVDASALAHALTTKSESANKLHTRFRHMRCHAPHLIDAELGNVLRKRVRQRSITPVQGNALLRAAGLIIGHGYPHVGWLAEAAWRLRDNVSFYDALYVALAARLTIPLVTGDRRLANASGLPCDIELIAG